MAVSNEAPPILVTRFIECNVRVVNGALLRWLIDLGSGVFTGDDESNSSARGALLLAFSLMAVSDEAPPILVTRFIECSVRVVNGALLRWLIDLSSGVFTGDDKSNSSARGALLDVISSTTS